MLANYVVRNADGHAKSIALLYEQRSNVIYAPAYDVVTTQAYPRFADNSPALSVEGRKTWAPGKSLQQFYKARLGISPRDYSAMVERLCESAVEVGREVIVAAKNERRWRDIAKQMLHAWNDGMASLRSIKLEDKYKSLSADIEAAGFSDATPPERPKAIGRSELLASRPSRKSKQSRKRRIGTARRR